MSSAALHWGARTGAPALGCAQRVPWTKYQIPDTSKITVSAWNIIIFYVVSAFTVLLLTKRWISYSHLWLLISSSWKIIRIDMHDRTSSVARVLWSLLQINFRLYLFFDVEPISVMNRPGPIMTLFDAFYLWKFQELGLSNFRTRL